jgi:hypothetical protein
MRKALDKDDLISHRLPAARESTKESIVTPVRGRETVRWSSGFSRQTSSDSPA